MNKKQKNKRKTRTIEVNHLARVEGEGGLFIETEGQKVTDVKLKIFESPRFFEALLRGRDFHEAPDITARICGICPVAYQMSACHAMEDACGLRVGGQIRELRRLLYCGEWIQSHVLHIYMLHAPDFLGYAGAVEMAKDHRQRVESGLALKKVGNQIMSLLGGREIHPINVQLGGFYRLPAESEFAALASELRKARKIAIDTIDWVSGFEFPELERDYTLVAVSHPDEYAMNEGRIISNRGLSILASEFDQYFEEQHVQHSNALHAVLKGQGEYLTGPMARFALNYTCLNEQTRQLAQQAGVNSGCRNPFKSIIIRALEVFYAIDEALRIIEQYQRPDEAAHVLIPCQNTGYAATEAPRGMLYHRYKIDASGKIQDALIVPPTSQNQKTIESDLRSFVEKFINAPQDTLRYQCEQAIRNYDPCISCATHFLKLHINGQQIAGPDCAAARGGH